MAPKAELQAHKAAFRKLFGDTLSDEFVDEMLNLLGLALAPGAWDQLEPGTLNAAIAIIASVKPQTELEALLAVQIVATGFAGLKFLQRGQSHSTSTGAVTSRPSKPDMCIFIPAPRGWSASSIRGRAAVGKMAARRGTIHRNRRANMMRGKLPMHLTPRCGARTRSGNSCRAPAMPNGRCRMHGGPSPGAPKGNKNALKHGLYTAEAITRRREMSGLMRAMRAP